MNTVLFDCIIGKWIRFPIPIALHTINPQQLFIFVSTDVDVLFPKLNWLSNLLQIHKFENVNCTIRSIRQRELQIVIAVVVTKMKILITYLFTQCYYWLKSDVSINVY